MCTAIREGATTLSSEPDLDPLSQWCGWTIGRKGEDKETVWKGRQVKWWMELGGSKWQRLVPISLSHFSPQSLSLTHRGCSCVHIWWLHQKKTPGYKPGQVSERGNENKWVLAVLQGKAKDFSPSSWKNTKEKVGGWQIWGGEILNLMNDQPFIFLFPNIIT